MSWFSTGATPHQPDENRLFTFNATEINGVQYHYVHDATKGRIYAANLHNQAPTKSQESVSIYLRARLAASSSNKEATYCSTTCNLRHRAAAIQLAARKNKQLPYVLWRLMHKDQTQTQLEHTKIAKIQTDDKRFD